MPKLTGIFLDFKNIDKFSIPEIALRLKTYGNIHILENFFGNRILYPQTVPNTALEMEIDLAIFAQAVSIQPDMVYNSSKNAIVLEEEFGRRLVPLQNLLKVIIDTLVLPDITPVFLKKAALIPQIGTIVIPRSLKPAQNNEQVAIMVNGQNLNLKSGSFSILPFGDHHLTLRIGDNKEILVSGGDLGLVVDLRKH